VVVSLVGSVDFPAAAEDTNSSRSSSAEAGPEQEEAEAETRSISSRRCSARNQAAVGREEARAVSGEDEAVQAAAIVQNRISRLVRKRACMERIRP
jgi:hypothetical protein